MLRIWQVVVATMLATTPVPGPPLVDDIQEGLRNRIEAAGQPARLVVRGDRTLAASALPAFYERRAYLPAWSGDEGPTSAATALRRAIRHADAEGLNPEHYHLEKIEALFAGRSGRHVWTTGELVDLDLLLTDAFLIYGSHLLAGRIDPVELTPEWIAVRRERDLVAVLESALAEGDIEGALENLLPNHPGYFRLREALYRFRALDRRGGWPAIEGGDKLARGDRSSRVLALRQRLGVEFEADGEIFDEALELAVRDFQRRHGLDTDGVVGAATLAALNVPAGERLRQVEINLERWRWLPEKLGQRYVLVNIANFELDVVEGGQTVLTMRVVVGRPYRRTPVFSDTIRYLVLNPSWHVPRNLAVQDILPQIKADPDYLARQGMKVLPAQPQTALQEVDPTTIDWSQVTAANFSYRLRQDPGPNNALGRVKFMFPNRFNVYLHDTPSRGLFEKSARDFSSGCIRIEKPLELAEYLLSDDPRWPRTRIDSTIARGTEETVRLPKAIPVHLLYWTAWAEDDGTIHFRNDIYSRDGKLREALRIPPPTP